MDWPGFCDGGYRLESPNSGPSESYNYYAETIEKGPRAGKLRLRQIPGLKDFITLPPGPMRGLWAGDNRLFAVSGGTFYEVCEDPTVAPTDLGNVGNGTNPAIIVSNGFQLAVASAGQLYVSFGPVVPRTCAPMTQDQTMLPVLDSAGMPVDAATIAFIDQYIIAAIQNTKQVQISNLAPHGETWDAADVAIKEAYSDNIRRIWVDQPGGELVWLFGTDTLEIWQNTGGLFPFQRIQGAVFPFGCDSAWSVAGTEGMRFWLWRGVVYGAAGLQPQRVSDYAIEQAIKGYSPFDQNNCEAFCYIEGGHLFYVLSFIEAGVTWVYDHAHHAWHRRAYWANNQWGRYRPRVYAKAFGKHFVGDYASGKIYTMDPTVFTDAGGVPLRRDRIAPYITDEILNVRYSHLRLDMDTGVGLSVAEDELGFDPQVSMRYSRDRGKRWSDWRTESLGRIGDTERRVVYPQLGSSRIGLTIHTSVTDPIDSSINAADLTLSRGTFRRT